MRSITYQAVEGGGLAAKCCENLVVWSVVCGRQEDLGQTLRDTPGGQGSSAAGDWEFAAEFPSSSRLRQSVAAVEATDAAGLTLRLWEVQSVLNRLDRRTASQDACVP